MDKEFEVQNHLEQGSVLVLLTSRYPNVGGDSSFLKNEAEVLSEAFSTVLVWSSCEPDGVTNLMPDNFVYMGSLGNQRRGLPPLQEVLKPAVLVGAARLVVEELRSKGISGFRHARRFLPDAIRTAIAVARVADGMSAESVGFDQAILYSFWSVDSGHVVALVGDRFHRSFSRAHGFDLYEDRMGYLPFRESLFRRATKVLAVSDNGRDYLAAMYPEFGSVFCTQRLGTADPLPLSRPPDRDVVSVVSCSSLTPVKRVDLIYETVRELANTVRVNWTHLGDGPLRPELESMFSSCENDNLTVDLRGQLSSEEVSEFYSQSSPDVFVNLSASEGVPVSIMEAMSYDMPILATDVGGTSELVSGSPKAGVIVEPDLSPLEYGKALAILLQNRHDFAPRQCWEERARALAVNQTLVALLRGSGAAK